MTLKNSKTRPLLLFPFLQNQNVHLALSLSLFLSAPPQHTNTSMTPSSLSTKPWQPLPKISARDRDTLPIINSSNEIDLFLIRKCPKPSLSRCFQPPASEVLSTSNTWRCKKVFFSCFEFIFWIFLFTYVFYFFFVLIL